MMSIMPAISLRQPWPWAIFYAGKPVENRCWPLPKKYLGKQVLIHASKQIDKEAVTHLLQLGFDVPEKLDTDGIVGYLRFIGCERDNPSEWAEPGLYHWIIDPDSVKPLPFYPLPGKLSFFNVQCTLDEEACL